MYLCEMKEQVAQPVLSIRFRAVAQDLPKHFGRIYGSIMQYLGPQGEQLIRGAFGAFHNMDMQNLDMEVGFSLSKAQPGKGEIQAGEIPAGMFAICHYTGPYDQIGPAYEQLTQYIASQGYAPSGLAYEWYLNGPDEVTSPQEYKTDIAFPVIRIAEKMGG